MAPAAQQGLGSLRRKEKGDPDDPTAKQAQMATTPRLRTHGQLSQDSVEWSLTAVTYQPTGNTAQ